MRAITAVPGRRGSVGVEDVPEPAEQDGGVLVRGRLIGVCGTDREIVEGAYGEPPPGERKLIIGHEGLGEVLEAPARLGLRARRPRGQHRPPPRSGPVPGVRRRASGTCAATTASPNAGSSGAMGSAASCGASNPSSRWLIPPALGELGVLLEPASVLAKAWDQVDRISERAFFLRGRALVTGVGPIGLLACLLGVQRGYEVHAVDVATEGLKRDLVEGLGAHYHAGDAADLDADVDVVIECTGLGAVGRAAGQKVASGGIMCLTGIMDADPQLDVDATALNRRMVLHNQLLFGTVNAGRRHWAQAADALAAADPAWLRAMITRRVPLTRWDEALDRQPDDIKVVVELAA